jgi:hypothetical protein
MYDFAGLNAHRAIFSAFSIAYTKETTTVKLLTDVCITANFVGKILRLAVYRTFSAIDQ